VIALARRLASLPTRWIIYVSESTGGRPIEYGFDTASYSTRRFRLHRPNRLKHPSDVSQLYGANRQFAEYGRGIDRKSSFPLRRVLDVAPASSMRGNVPLSTLVERHRLGGFHFGGGAQRVSRLDGIPALFEKFAAIRSSRSRFG
jgi:hypothetical protein